MSSSQDNVRAQVELYGEPLGEVFSRICEQLDVSRARLAGIIGLSPPMLSQLGSGKRAKIGNPAVLHRLSALRELAGQVAAGRHDGDLQADIEAVRGSTAQWADTSTHATGAATAAQGVGAGGTGGGPDVRDYLRAVASARDLERAAERLEDDFPELATFLGRVGAGSPQEAREHLKSLQRYL